MEKKIEETISKIAHTVFPDYMYVNKKETLKVLLTKLVSEIIEESLKRFDEIN